VKTVAILAVLSRRRRTAVRDVTTVSAPPPPGLTPTTGTIVGARYYSVAGATDAETKDRRARILRAQLR
jgi:hypothetical protein